MLPEFSRTLRAMEADRGVAAWTLGATLSLMVGWGLWMSLAQVEVQEQAQSARIVAEGAARLSAPEAGVVSEVAVAVGQRVEAGQLLVSLEDSDLRLRVEAAEARVRELNARLAALGDEAAASAAGQVAGQQVLAADAATTDAQVEEAQAYAAEAEAERARVAALLARGAASRAELDSAEAEARASAARVQALLGARRGASAARAAEGYAGDAARSRLIASGESIQAERAGAEAELERLRRDLNARSLRAPVAGIVVERPPLSPGQRVEAGALLVVLAPDGPRVVEASFDAERAIGRVMAGQEARVRVRAEGALAYRPATVLRVGGEARDGRVMVELALADTSAASLTHGLVAEVIVTVDHRSPLEIAFDAAGGAR
jgi:multidrug resistance efflux pump